MTLPIFVTALIPISTLRKQNEWLANPLCQEGEVYSKENDQTVDLNSWSIPETSFLPLLWDMWIFCYHTYGSYDPPLGAFIWYG